MTEEEKAAIKRRDARSLWTTVGVVVLLAVGGTVWLIQAPKRAEAKLIASAQAVAASKLRDPSSAQFRNVTAGSMFVCGEINGKNGFGAYNGFTRFYATKDSAEIDPGDGGPTFYGEPVMKAAFERAYTGYCS